eukprot:CAMPEP_0181460706 /NCGR_PEP_ID=MMETSP1110-20121109/33484_1 /TAXON_ID=174948 /ORGANISM="Symbiodinium sp., Strain CCMP421" /LENGTH=76 /DNA_ID=CAMNT_0023585275 /DNA_START=547 /DNA_END=777 /DNA_ORIENTATION=+
MRRSSASSTAAAAAAKKSASQDAVSCAVVGDGSSGPTMDTSCKRLRLKKGSSSSSAVSARLQLTIILSSCEGAAEL